MFRFFSSLWYSFKEYLILLLIAGISIFIMTKNDHPALHGLRSFSFGLFAGVSSVVNSVIPSSFFDDDAEMLRQKNAELMIELNTLRRQAINYSELKRMLGFRDTSSFSLMPAEIINKSIVNEEKTLVARLADGFNASEGMPVITEAGLVGLVSGISGQYITIRTVKSLGLKLVVEEERTQSPGILRWDGRKLFVTNIPKSVFVRVGDRIMTSVNSSIIHLPLPIGRVKKILNPEEGIMYSLEVEPYVPIERIDNVFVVRQERGNQPKGTK